MMPSKIATGSCELWPSCGKETNQVRGQKTTTVAFVQYWFTSKQLIRVVLYIQPIVGWLSRLPLYYPLLQNVHPYARDELP